MVKWISEYFMKGIIMIMLVFPTLCIILSYPFGDLKLTIFLLVCILVVNILCLILSRCYSFTRLSYWLFVTNPFMHYELFLLYGKDEDAIIFFLMASDACIIGFICCYGNSTHVFLVLWAFYVYCLIRTFMNPRIKILNVSLMLIFSMMLIHVKVFLIFRLHRESKKIPKYQTMLNYLIDILPLSIIITTLDGINIIKINNVAMKSFQTLGSIDTIQTLFYASNSEIKVPILKFLKYNQRKFIYMCCQIPSYPNNITIIAADITDYFNQEETELRKNMQWLYTNTTNHQLRTPLSIIDGMLTLLKEELVSESGKKNLKVTQLSVTNLRHIIDDTLILRDDNATIKHEKFNMNQVLSDLSLLFNMEAEQKNITFEIDGVPAILDLVADGAGNAVLTKHAVKSSFRPSAFITKSFKEPKIQIPVTLATSSRRPSTQIQIKTIELLKRIVVENIQKVF